MLAYWLFPDITFEDRDVDVVDLLEKLDGDSKRFAYEISNFDDNQTRYDKLDFLSSALEVIHTVEEILHFYGISHREFNDAIKLIRLTHELSGSYGQDKRSAAEKNNAQNGCI